MGHVREPAVAEVFDAYPDEVRPKLERLAQLILDCADEVAEVDSVEETLKWGEPSYLTKHGSTIRLDWKERDPEHYAMYFKCTSLLVPTFRELFDDVFTFDGNRAIVLHLDDEVPEDELRQCVEAGLRYHKVKKLPQLGIGAD